MVPVSHFEELKNRDWWYEWERMVTTKQKKSKTTYRNAFLLLRIKLKIRCISLDWSCYKSSTKGRLLDQNILVPFQVF